MTVTAAYHAHFVGAAIHSRTTFGLLRGSRYTRWMRRYLVSATLLMTTLSAAGQWSIQDAHTTSSLRGIHSLGNGVAWASGTGGTVLRTKDGGATWEHCATPPDAEKLDFRGVQGFDASTSIVMSSGKGDLSRLYKTTDGCQTWKQLFTNPDKEGFWDAISFWTPTSAAGVKPQGIIIGDPVDGTFPIFLSDDAGDSWRRFGGSGTSTQGGCGENRPKAAKDEGLFAASNQSLLEFFGSNLLFVTGGPSGARFFYADSDSLFGDLGGPCKTHFSQAKLPLAHDNSSSGAFAIAAEDMHSYFPLRLMVVGGDYSKPDQPDGTAAFIASKDGMHLPLSSYFSIIVATNPPHGYRSAVVYDSPTKTWITVGPNGTDVSTDDGRNWRALKPGPNDAPDADRNWNALSLPFVVGPHGRIGVLRPEALNTPK